MHKLAALLATLCLLVNPFGALAGGPIISWPNTDPAMATAFQNANDTLDLFLENPLDRRGIAADYNNLKAAFAVNAPDMTHELIWVSNSHRISQTSFEGRLDNRPRYIAGKEYRSHDSFSRDQIRDWGHLAFDGKLYGHYTTRLLITSMSRKKALEVQQILSKDPIPANWKNP